MGRKSIVPELETKIGQPLKPWLTARIREGKSPEQIAGELSIGKSRVYTLIKDFDLKNIQKEARTNLAAGETGELRVYFDKYMDEKRTAGMSKKTISKDETLFRLYIWWLEAFKKPLNLNAIKDSDILKEFFAYLNTQTNRFGHQKKKPVSPMGQESYAKQLKAFVHWLQRNEIISDEPRANPFNKIMKIRIPKKKPEDIPDNIIQKLLNSFGNSFNDVRNKTIGTWFLETGMRKGGVASIKMSSFNWETGVGTVIEKGNKERTIVLSNSLREQLKIYMEIREPLAKNDYLWIEESGKRVTADGIYIIVHNFNKVVKDDIKEQCPGQRFHPHLFRHIWAKHLALSEVPGFAMMVMAGWENLALVQHYAAAYTQEKAWSYINTASPLSKFKI